MRARSFVAVAATFTLAAGVLAGSTTSASGRAAPQVTTISSGLVGPLSVAQAPDGTQYVVDSFAGKLYRLGDNGARTIIYKSKTRSPEGVSADGGLLRFTTGADDNSKGLLWTLDGSDNPVLVANIGKYEKSANPDGVFKYGFLNTPKSCLDKVHGLPVSYRGRKETHPYATASVGTYTFVADAGANAIFLVGDNGAVSTIAALKPVKVKITAAGAQANGLPACTVGRKYAFEAVPTDIEVGPDAYLYVTSLPGGPEDGSLGAHGRVLRINPVTGDVTTLAGGLVSPTGLAVAANGDIFVAQLFAGVISRIAPNTTKAKPYVKVPLPAAVEAIPTGLLATINALPGQKPKGKVVTITP